MTARRRFFHSCIAAWAFLSLPATAMAVLSSVKNLQVPEVGTTKPKIKFIGVGGAGCNAIEHMIAGEAQGLEFLCANTDAQSLTRSRANRTIQLGGSGLGTGGQPNLARLAAAGAESEIRAALIGAHLLYITAGMGGGTGSGAAPVIARIARDMGIPTVGIVTTPFAFEGEQRMCVAVAGLTALQASVDSLFVVSNEKLLEVLGDDTTQTEFFARANGSICSIVENSRFNVFSAAKRQDKQ
jgi:cell division protein FtsZ